jgi:hypothetical protein
MTFQDVQGILLLQFLDHRITLNANFCCTALQCLQGGIWMKQFWLTHRESDLMTTPIPIQPVSQHNSHNSFMGNVLPIRL